MGGEKINREAGKNRASKKVNKVIRKKNWQQKGKNKGEDLIENAQNKNKGKAKAVHRVEGVVFIPFTPYSAMKKELQEWEEKFTATHEIPKVRFMERVGNKIRDMICVANL